MAISAWAAFDGDREAETNGEGFSTRAWGKKAVFNRKVKPDR